MDTLEEFFNNQTLVNKALSDHSKLKGAFTKTIFGLNHVHQLRTNLKNAEKAYIAATTTKHELEPQVGSSHAPKIQAEIDRVTKAIRVTKDRLQGQETSVDLTREYFERAVTQQLNAFVEHCGNAEIARELLEPKRKETLLDALVRSVVKGKTSNIPEDVVRNVNRRIRRLEERNAEISVQIENLNEQLANYDVDVRNLHNMLADDDERLHELGQAYDVAYKTAENARADMKSFDREIRVVLEKTWESFCENTGLSRVEAVRFLNRYLATVPRKTLWSLPSI